MAEPGAAQYRWDRREFYARFPQFWSDTADGEEYAVYGVYPLPESEQREIRQAVRALWHLFTRAAPLLRSLPDEALTEMGLPPSTLAIARHCALETPETVIGRFDLVASPDGYKMLELNADTPTFLVETFHLNGAVCAAFGVLDPNAGEEARLAAALTEACRAGLRQVGKGEGPACVAWASYGEHREDRETTQYLRRLVDLPPWVETLYVPIEALRVDDNGLFDGEGRRIDVLFRLYPLEFFAEDQDSETGTPVGEMLFRLVEQNLLALINPPSAFLLQSKAVQAVLWGLADDGAYFDAEERALIQKHLLPTYLDPALAGPHVVKPVYGREGDTVTVVDVGRTCASEAQSFTDQIMVYQQYVPMPEAALMTAQGMQRFSLLTSCFVVGGEPSAIGLRAGGLITDDRCRFVPVGGFT